MKPLTKEEEKMNNKQKVCYICKKNLVLMRIIKNSLKEKIIVIILENTEVLLMISAI